MSKISKLLGKEAIHADLGAVEVISAVNGSRTKVNIKVVQRAKGWDEQSQSYKPVKRFIPTLNKLGVEIGKTFTQKKYNDNHSQYGHEDICHIDKLKLV